MYNVLVLVKATLGPTGRSSNATDAGLTLGLDGRDDELTGGYHRDEALDAALLDRREDPQPPRMMMSHHLAKHPTEASPLG